MTQLTITSPKPRPGQKPSTSHSPAAFTSRPTATTQGSPRPGISHCVPWANLPGQRVSISPDVPASFGCELAGSHKAIAKWVALNGDPDELFSVHSARHKIEATFTEAALAALQNVHIANLAVEVHDAYGDEPPAISIITTDIGQLDLGWIEDSELPHQWRASAYQILAQTLPRFLPVTTFDDFIENASQYLWGGETDDEKARQELMDYQGYDEQDLVDMSLPSDVINRQPTWMLSANAVADDELPDDLRTAILKIRTAVQKFDTEDQGRAWSFDTPITERLPIYEDLFHLPPLTIVPLEQYAAEYDEVARTGMEYGFTDITGLRSITCPDDVQHWLASLQLGAQILQAVDDLIRLYPATFSEDKS